MKCSKLNPFLLPLIDEWDKSRILISGPNWKSMDDGLHSTTAVGKKNRPSSGGYVQHLTVPTPTPIFTPYTAHIVHPPLPLSSEEDKTETPEPPESATPETSETSPEDDLEATLFAMCAS